MKFFEIDPLKDARWAALVGRHPKASVFHTVPWLQALQRTYGYKPVAFTTTPPSTDLHNGLVFCRISSWLTGRRLVSLPFSDHCELLCDSTDEASFLLGNLQAELKRQNWKYLELRPVSEIWAAKRSEMGFSSTGKYYLHIVDIRPDLDAVFRSLDNDSVRRRVGRAERANLVEKSGRSDELLRDFYNLFVITRARHSLPPIPNVWFRNLIQYFGDTVEIRAAYKGKTPISAILTLWFKDAVFYKYGCSDVRFNKYGGPSWLLWRAIAAAKSMGAVRFDMGRTEEANAGLLAFKNHWVAQPQRLTYWKFPEEAAFISVDGWKLKLAKQLFSHMPQSLLRVTGKLIYRHIG